MKIKSLNKKLALKKITVARLNNVELNHARGGAEVKPEDTWWPTCDTCPGICTCHHTCCTCSEVSCPDFGCK